MRATFDFCRRNWLKPFQQFAPETEQPIMRRLSGIPAQGDSLSPARAVAVDHCAIALVKIGDLVTQKAGSLFGMVEHLGDGADIFFGIDAVDSLQFTKPAQLSA